MKKAISEYAVYETRIIPDPETCGNCTKKVRGWFDKKSNRLYGKNFEEAADKIQIRYTLFNGDILEITR